MNWKMLGAACVLGMAMAGCGGGGNSKPEATSTQVPGPAEAKVEADKLFNDLQDAITRKDWYPADAAVMRLDVIKQNLPADYVTKIETMKKSLLAAKAAAARGQ
jgi:hypothetical protein